MEAPAWVSLQRWPYGHGSLAASLHRPSGLALPLDRHQQPLLRPIAREQARMAGAQQLQG